MKRIVLSLVMLAMIALVTSCAPQREHCPTYGKANTVKQNAARV